MTLVKGMFRVLFLLFLQSVIWPLNTCKPIEKAAELSPRDNDQIGPDLYQRTLFPPFVRTTFNPPNRTTYQSRNKYAELSPQDDDKIGPYFSQNTLWPPFVWPTFNPHDWPTYRPPRNDSNVGMPIGIKVFIFVLIGIAALIALLCKYYVCQTDESTSESTTILHPPPHQLVLPISMNRNFQQHSNVIMPTNAGRSFIPSSNIQQFQNEILPVITGSSNVNNIADKPPSYSDVVTSDLSRGPSIFPDVSPTAPGESPPPKYDKGNLL